jgi:D-inositol-3-phosphate glycosyltransferase
LIGSDLGGIRDTIDDGHSGYLVPPEDPTSLAEALRRCLSDPSLALGLGEAARAGAVRYYESRDSGLAKLRDRMQGLAGAP